MGSCESARMTMRCTHDGTSEWRGGSAAMVRGGRPRFSAMVSSASPSMVSVTSYGRWR